MTQYTFLKAFLTSRIDSDRGASMVEYALLLALIAVIAIAAITSLGQTVSGNFDLVNSNLGG